MTLQRDSLIDALHRKAQRLFSRAEYESSDEMLDRFDETWNLLERWEDTTQDKYFNLRLGEARLRGQLGQALKLVNDHLDSSDKGQDMYELRLSLLEELGWDHWIQLEERWMLLRFPTEYPPF